MKIYILKKSMPGCPEGRLFKQNSGGEYFHSMTDTESISGELLDYKFPRHVVEHNSEWFVLQTENHDEKPWEIGRVEMLEDPEIGYPIYANKIKTQTGNVYIIDMTSDESFIPRLSKLINIIPMKTITDLEKAAIKAKFILNPKVGIITQSDGNFEVWGEWPGFKPDSIACEKTEQEAIESAIKYLEAYYE